jgi:hypothetical protein
MKASAGGKLHHCVRNSLPSSNNCNSTPIWMQNMAANATLAAPPPACTSAVKWQQESTLLQHVMDLEGWAMTRDDHAASEIRFRLAYLFDDCVDGLQRL